MLALAFVLLGIGFIVSLVGGIMMIVAAFRVSALWGCAVIFVPFASLFFLVKYWAEAKRSFMISLAGGAVTAVAWVALFFGAANAGGDALARAAAEANRQEQPARSAPAERGSRAARPAAEPAAAPSPGKDGAAAVEQAEAQPAADEPLPAPEEDADEVAAFERLAQATGPDTLNSEIRPRDLAKHIGEKLVVVQRDGDEIRGTLLGVDPRTLRIERELAGGSVRYEIARTEIKEVRQAQ